VGLVGLNYRTLPDLPPCIGWGFLPFEVQT